MRKTFTSNTSLAYFEIHEENRAEEDTEYNNLPPNALVDWAYVGIKAKTKGYEAEISDELAPGWQVQAGYTHKVIRDDSGLDRSLGLRTATQYVQDLHDFAIHAR